MKKTNKNMTPKAKAKELIEEYLKELLCDEYNLNNRIIYNELAKQCALMAVDEILNNNCGSHTDEANATNSEIYCDEYFWNDVKSELRQYIFPRMCFIFPNR
jgi:hypothetical protein